MADAIQPLGRTSFGKPEDAGNVLSEQEALDLLNNWVENERLRLHMKQVGAVMKGLGLGTRKPPGRGSAQVVAGRPAA
jgi:predicted hydrolase (HD superfamily)